jgi:hypothetical protein
MEKDTRRYIDHITCATLQCKHVLKTGQHKSNVLFNIKMENILNKIELWMNKDVVQLMKLDVNKNLSKNKKAHSQLVQ